MRSTVIRRLAGVTTAAALVVGSLVAVPAAATEEARPRPARYGLYGSQDPTYDGVYRQGLAILALRQARAAIDPAAVRWLLRQQCANGRWTSWRAHLKQPCGPADSNATAMAVMALEAVGRHRAADRGAAWLVRHQATGGGWRYTKGWPVDANSTGLAIQALRSVGITPLTVSNNGTGFDFLARVQLGCDADPAVRGALDYSEQVPLVANDFATAQATQALARVWLPIRPRTGSDDLPEMSCLPARAAVSQPPKALAAGYLGRLIAANDGFVPSAWSEDPDYGSTANAVLSLVAAGYGAQQVEQAMAALETSARDYVLDDQDAVLPASAALLILAEKTTGGDPTEVDGLNLVRALRRTITT